MPMLRWALLRTLWMVPTLIGITFVTFLVMDLAPVDRAAMEVAMSREADSVGLEPREVAVARLRVRYGLVDPDTLEPVPMVQRYGRWLWNAVNLRFHGDGEDPREFRRRIAGALPVSILLGFWALVVAIGVGAPLGCWLGMRAGSRADRAATSVMFALFGLPDVLLATLMILWFGGPVFDWLPTAGLRSDGSERLSVFGQLLDLAGHLVLPVTVLAMGPTLLVVRFVRESVGRAAASTFALNLEVWGIDPATRRRRLLRAGLTPVATIAGALLPMLVTGSIVVESVFSIEGLGRLSWNAVRGQDQSMVMALTLIGSSATLVSLALSDLLHRWIDPRVQLAP
ncbi:MAG: ABC transporter permease [Planctomycetota bacterium]